MKSTSRLVLGAVLLMAAGSAWGEPDAKTLRTWKAKCASCHGVDGKAQTETAAKLGIPDMTTAAFQSKVSDAQAKKAILEGVKREGKDGMDSYRDALSDEQVEALVKVVRGFGK